MDSLTLARFRRGLSKRALAQLSGVDRGTIRRAETGQRVSARTAARLAQALGCDVLDILSPAILVELEVTEDAAN